MAPIGGARAGYISGVGDVIPDSVVSRDPDDENSSLSQNAYYGVQIETSQEWPEIGAEKSATQTGEMNEAAVFRVSDGQLMGENTNIGNVVGGGTFTINLDNNLQPGETYNFVLRSTNEFVDNLGRDTDPTYPYTSSDGNLQIVNGANGETTTANRPGAILKVGNVGFN